jgi:hypothetical protein
MLDTSSMVISYKYVCTSSHILIIVAMVLTSFCLSRATVVITIVQKFASSQFQTWSLTDLVLLGTELYLCFAGSQA